MLCSTLFLQFIFIACYVSKYYLFTIKLLFTLKAFMLVGYNCV